MGKFTKLSIAVFKITLKEGANKSMVAQAHSQVTNQGGLLQA